jgi:hypothetical protein
MTPSVIAGLDPAIQVSARREENWITGLAALRRPGNDDRVGVSFDFFFEIHLT